MPMVPMVPMVGRCFICGYLCNPHLINCSLPGLDGVAVFCSHSCLNRGRDLYGYRQPPVPESKIDANNVNYINNVYNDNFNEHLANDNTGKQGCSECEKRSKRVLVDFGVQVDLMSHYESDLDDHVMVSPVNGEYAANMECASSPDFYEDEGKGTHKALIDNNTRSNEKANDESKCNGNKVDSSAMLSEAANNLAKNLRVDKNLNGFVGGVDENVVFVEKESVKQATVEEINNCNGATDDKLNKNGVVTNKCNSGNKSIVTEQPSKTVNKNSVDEKCPDVGNVMDKANKDGVFDKHNKNDETISGEGKNVVTKLQQKREIRRAKKQIRKQQRQLYAQSRNVNVVSPSTITSNDTSGPVTPMNEDNSAIATNENSGNATPMNESINEEDMPKKPLSTSSLENSQLEDRRLTKRQQKIERRRLLAATQKHEKAAKRMEMQIKTAYDEAKQLLRDGKAVQAAIRINYALKDHSERPELYSLRSDCYCALEKAERAIEDAAMAVKLKQSDENLVKLFEMQLRANCRNEAMETCEMIEDKLLKAATKEKASH